MYGIQLYFYSQSQAHTQSGATGVAPENPLQATPPLTPVYLLFYPALAAAIVWVAYVNVFAACQQF